MLIMVRMTCLLRVQMTQWEIQSGLPTQTWRNQASIVLSQQVTIMGTVTGTNKVTAEQRMLPIICDFVQFIPAQIGSKINSSLSTSGCPQDSILVTMVYVMSARTIWLRNKTERKLCGLTYFLDCMLQCSTMRSATTLFTEAGQYEG